MGTVVALPLLDAMLSSTRAPAETIGNATQSFPKRLAFVYVPQGKNMEDWTPKAFGENYDLPMILEPLKDFQKDFTLLTGLAHEQANALGDGGGDHARTSATYLTGCHAKKTAGADIKAGISVDQIAAGNAIGDQTRLPSLELSCDGGQKRRFVRLSGYSCAPISSIFPGTRRRSR